MIRKGPNSTMTDVSDYIVDLQGVTFRRGQRVIFDGVDIRIPRGKVTGIMGPSGCGKTTLLRLIGAQLRPESGSIWVNGRNIPELGREQLFAARQDMGMLFQSGALFTDLSVFENVAFPLRVHTELPEDMIRDIVLLKLQAVGLRGARDLMPDELSGGMKRRVALARAIALDPQLMMYDEPFTGQDPTSFNKLLELIITLNNSLNMTSIIVSHDIEESLNISDHIIIVADTKILASDTPENIRNSKNPEVQNFLNGKSLNTKVNEADKNFFISEVLKE